MYKLSCLLVGLAAIALFFGLLALAMMLSPPVVINVLRLTLPLAEALRVEESLWAYMVVGATFGFVGSFETLVAAVRKRLWPADANSERG